MAINLCPKIVTSGLVLNLDGGNGKSYSGSGTTWRDLSGNGNNATLFNGPTFSTTRSGMINFDGSNDYADFTVSGLGSTASVEMWAKINSLPAAGALIGWYVYDVILYVNSLGYNTGNNDLYGLTNTQITNLGLIGNWKHYVFEMRSDVSYTNNKLYVNGISQTSLTQVTGTENSGNRNFNSGNGRISGLRYDTNYPAPMDLGVFKIYNRSLTPNEVLQNYDATKGRFGL